MKTLVPCLPDNAPFTSEQRAWLNGFLAGWSAGGTQQAPAASTTGDGAGPSMVPALGPSLGGDGRAGGLPEPVFTAPSGPQTGGHDRTRPFAARLSVNRPLSGAGSDKDVRHIEIDLTGSGLTYAVGDALGVVPQNCPGLVAELVAALGCSGEEPVVLGGVTLPLEEALRARRTITQPPKPLLEAFARRNGDMGPGERPVAEGQDVLDLVRAYPAVRFEPQAFVDLLRPLQHRLYSIASSPKAHPGRVHLTVGTVRYDAHGRARKGVCSTFLADRCTPETPLPVFVHANPNFRLPTDPATPVIMIGPGTGIAPFRAFLAERRATGAPGKNWLFFGDRRAATDYLYRDELEGFLNDGVLDRLDLAWSRDGAGKVYVQHRMRAHAAALYAWLEEGAAVYVCGDASRMAKDVDAALHEVVRTAAGLSEDAATTYVKTLKRTGRYRRDVY